MQNDEKRIGVLYLDSREKGALLSRAARAALETLATEAAVAIENARLYRETLEKARMEQEMRIAAEIQQALLPEPQPQGRASSRRSAQSVPCRAIGGDFFDYVDLPDGGFGFAVGDVAGKGAPAALLTAVLQGVFSAQASSGSSPAETLSKVNLALIRRAIESRFATGLYAIVRAGRRADLLQRRPQPADGLHQDGRQAPREGRADPRALRARHLRGRDRGRSSPAICSSPSATASPKR